MRHLFAYIFCLFILTSCFDDSYKGSIESATTGMEPSPVMLSVGSYSPQGSKGSGVIDDEKTWLWKELSIYVYAFRNDANTFSPLSSDIPSDGSAPWCLIDASKDVSGSKAGKLAYVNDVDSFVIWDKDGNRLLYPEGMTAYDFYAYYVDDFKVDENTIRRNDESISLDVEIDGSMDVMSSKATLRESQLDRADFTLEDRINVSRNVFSAYTANRNIHPELYFKHHLSRLTFEIYAGRESSTTTRIQDISIESKSKGIFTVVHADTTKIGLDFSADDEYVILPLRENDGSPLKQDVYGTIWTSGDEYKDVYERRGVIVGNSSLLVAPDDDYTFYITLQDTMESGKVNTQTKEVELVSQDGTFLPGKHYWVRLAIYGLDYVEVDVSTKPWNYGGEIIIDGEDYGQ